MSDKPIPESCRSRDRPRSVKPRSSSRFSRSDLGARSRTEIRIYARRVSEWTHEYHQAGAESLKTNRKDQEAKHQAEIKRLLAKIGRLVMVDEFRQDAMRLFFRTIRRRACGRQRLRIASTSLSTSSLRREILIHHSVGHDNSDNARSCFNLIEPVQ